MLEDKHSRRWEKGYRAEMGLGWTHLSHALTVRMASDDEVDQERDSGMTQMCYKRLVEHCVKLLHARVFNQGPCKLSCM